MSSIITYISLLSVLKCSPLSRVAILPPEPLWWVETLTNSACVERIWCARCKPPNTVVNQRQHSYNVTVNKTIKTGESHSPLYRAVRILPKPSFMHGICTGLMLQPFPDLRVSCEILAQPPPFARLARRSELIPEFLQTIHVPIFSLKGKKHTAYRFRSTIQSDNPRGW